MKCFRFIACTILAFATVGAFLCVPSFAAAATSFVLSARTTDGDSQQWDLDAVMSATNRAFTDPLNTYAEENGFELICYERVNTSQTTDAPVYYHFNSPDSQNHYYITLAYNVHLTETDDGGSDSGVTTFMPTSTNESGYLYSYTVEQTMNSYVSLEATFAVWEYPSSGDYTSAIMILDYDVPMNPSLEAVVPGSDYSFYFPIYAPQIVSDYDEAVFIIENIVTSIEGQTEEVTDAISQQTEDLKDYFDGEDNEDYDVSAAQAAEDTVEGWFDTAIDNVGSIFSTWEVDLQAISTLVPYFTVPFSSFSGAITTVAVIYFVQRVLL